MYDQVTWDDIARMERADDPVKGVCADCGNTDYLADVMGRDMCYDCEAQLSMEMARERWADYDDGIIWEDDH